MNFDFSSIFQPILISALTGAFSQWVISRVKEAKLEQQHIETVRRVELLEKFQIDVSKEFSEMNKNLTWLKGYLEGKDDTEQKSKLFHK
jgi:hypothetical protein